MPDAARRGIPTPPIRLDTAPGGLRVRFASRSVAVDDTFVERLRGACERVDTDLANRVDAGRDWWPLTVAWALAGEVPACPAVIARPSSVAEVASVLACCDQAGVPVTPSAGRSGVCGASIPVFGGVVLDLTGLSGITGVDDRSLLVDVRPGTFGDLLEDDLRARFRLTLGHWPQSIALSTVGGWLACRSAGQYSTRYGKIEDMVVGLEVALADGRVIRTGGAAPRAATGPDLTQLFVGSEGTLGVITEARLRARPEPSAERRACYGFSSFEAGLDACRRILRRGATPAVLRLYDATEAARNYDLVDRSLLVVLDEGDAVVIDAVMAVVDDECRRPPSEAVRLDDGLVDRWLKGRNDISVLESVIRSGLTVDTIEIAARWSALPAIYEGAIAALRAIDGTLAASAHQSHAYPDGACLYFTFAGQPAAEGALGAAAAAAENYYVRAWDAVMATTLANGGALSHHHGIGLNRGRHLAQALGGSFDMLRSLKASLDPRGILNPGKLGLPSPFGDAPWP
ncbi:MAG TPA: FAD-binding oxidoreductase [Acidimicrobiales bacterium]|nr:FAD-binding oxidoreductase [Acidimicrobiales bacterium]